MATTITVADLKRALDRCSLAWDRVDKARDRDRAEETMDTGAALLDAITSAQICSREYALMQKKARAAGIIDA